MIGAQLFKGWIALSNREISIQQINVNKMYSIIPMDRDLSSRQSCSAFEQMVLGCQKIIPCCRQQFLWGLPSPKRSGQKMTVSLMPQPCIVVFSLITHSQCRCSWLDQYRLVTRCTVFFNSIFNLTITDWLKGQKKY